MIGVIKMARFPAVLGCLVILMLLMSAMSPARTLNMSSSACSEDFSSNQRIASNLNPDQRVETKGDTIAGWVKLVGFWHIFDESEPVDVIALGAKIPPVGSVIPAVWYINASTGDIYEIFSEDSLRYFILDYGEFDGSPPREIVVSTGPTAHGLVILNLTSSLGAVSAEIYRNYTSLDPNSVAIFDMGNDSIDDIFADDRSGLAYIINMSSDTTISYAKPLSYSQKTFVADYNGDDYEDLFVVWGNNVSSSDYVKTKLCLEVILGNNASRVHPLNLSIEYVDVEFANVDNDSLPELVIVGLNRILIWDIETNCTLFIYPFGGGDLAILDESRDLGIMLGGSNTYVIWLRKFEWSVLDGKYTSATLIRRNETILALIEDNIVDLYTVDDLVLLNRLAYTGTVDGFAGTDLNGDSLHDIVALYEWESFYTYFTLESLQIEYSPPSILSIEHDPETPTVEDATKITIIASAGKYEIKYVKINIDGGRDVYAVRTASFGKIHEYVGWLSDLTSGNHTIRIYAIDEYGTTNISWNYTIEVKGYVIKSRKFQWGFSGMTYSAFFANYSPNVSYCVFVSGPSEKTRVVLFDENLSIVETFNLSNLSGSVGVSIKDLDSDSFDEILIFNQTTYSDTKETDFYILDYNENRSVFYKLAENMYVALYSGRQQSYFCLDRGLVVLINMSKIHIFGNLTKVKTVDFGYNVTLSHLCSGHLLVSLENTTVAMLDLPYANNITYYSVPVNPVSAIWFNDTHILIFNSSLIAIFSLITENTKVIFQSNDTKAIYVGRVTVDDSFVALIVCMYQNYSYTSFVLYPNLTYKKMPRSDVLSVADWDGDGGAEFVFVGEFGIYVFNVSMLKEEEVIRLRIGEYGTYDITLYGRRILRNFDEIFAVQKFENDTVRVFVLANIEIYKIPKVYVNISSIWVQGLCSEVEVTIYDRENRPVEDASVYIVVGNIKYDLEPRGEGVFSTSIDTKRLPLGKYSALIIVDSQYYEDKEITKSVVVTGYLRILSSVTAVTITQLESRNVSFFVTDEYYHVINCTFRASIDSVNLTVHYVEPSYIVNITGELPAGRHNLTLYAENPYVLEPAVLYIPVDVIGLARWSIYGDGVTEPIVQGRTAKVFLNLTDVFSTPIAEARVELIISSAIFIFSHNKSKAGMYSAMIPTDILSSGIHEYDLIIMHKYLTTVRTNGTFTVIGVPKVSISLSSKRPTQYEYLNVTAVVTDMLGYPIKELTVVARLGDKTIYMEKVDPVTYTARIFLDYRHGRYNLTISISGPYCVNHTEYEKIEILARLPTVRITKDLFPAIIATVILVSVALSILYVKYSSTTVNFSESWPKVVRLLEMYYVASLIAFISLGSYMMLISVQNPGLALLLGATGFLLLILMSMMWVLRDSYLIIAKGKTRLAYLAVSILHIALIALLIYQIIRIGSSIEWFQAYVLERTREIYGFKIPEFAIAVLSVFIGNYALLAPFTYRKSIKMRNRIEKLIAANVDPSIISSEINSSQREIANEVRNKTLVFIGLMGTSLASYLSIIIKYVDIILIVGLPIIAIIALALIVPWVIRVTLRKKHE